eukprot:6192292-Pleurochrysis_carterae.AAC.5
MSLDGRAASIHPSLLGDRPGGLSGRAAWLRALQASRRRLSVLVCACASPRLVRILSREFDRGRWAGLASGCLVLYVVTLYTVTSCSTVAPLWRGARYRSLNARLMTNCLINNIPALPTPGHSRLFDCSP